MTIGFSSKSSYATETWANTLPAINQGLVHGALPPPGTYGVYNSYWASFSGYDNHGKANGTKLDAYIQVPILFWVPGYKILGANYAAAIALPFDYTNFKMAGASALSNNGHWGMFNAIVEPVILSWDLGNNLYVKAGLAVAVDNASSSAGHPPSGNGAPSGNGYWSLEPEFGISWLNDGWNVSANIQYGYNFINSTTDYKSGQQISGTYTITKTLGKWTLGVGAYSINQITADTGAGAVAAGCPGNGGCRLESYGAGPLIGYQFGGVNLVVNYTRSIYTRNYVGGNIVNARLIIPFD
ncbi:SphA family protein [Cupriavidus sp. IDO]|uniref:SphA family protein n=1 Tax=Cupriavidus sp. IDO TaxID=1539142 RepID=UPI00187C0B1A|nr:transporter [Cupriavidus sp. IDO]